MPKQEFERRPLEDLKQKRARQAIEGIKAMADYQRNEMAIRERTSRLRAQRLAKERSAQQGNEQNVC